MIFRHKKKLGQHFLLNEKISEKIVSIKKIENEEVIEIGPGKGHLTKKIISQKPSKLTLIEKDISLKPYLKKIIKKYEIINVNLIFDDVTKLKLSKFSKKKQILIANLPYNIASTLIIDWLTYLNKFKCLIIMVQKEVAERLSAKVKSKFYGRLSILIQLHANVISKFDVGAENFFPKPKVESCVLEIIPKTKKNFNYKNLDKILRIAFFQRRKTLKNNLIKYDLMVEKKIIGCGINPSCRPQELSPLDYLKLSKALF